MLKIKEAIIVEGIYDKKKLQPLVDACIIPTQGFRIFKDKEKMLMIKALAEKNGIVILTDSDQAGFKIRNHLKGCIPDGKIKHAYIPEILGKEKRKAAPSKAGLLGVEGMDDAVLAAALKKAGCLSGNAPSPKKAVTRQDFYLDGLSGGEKSAQRRRALCRHLGFPARMSCGALLEAVNALMDYDAYRALVDGFLQEDAPK